MERRIVVDTREQRPYEFDNSIRNALKCADYSLEGLESVVAIERKSQDDLIGTLLRGKARFHAELSSLRKYKFAVVVIETTTAELFKGNYKSAITPEALMGIICSMMLKYHPVHFVFAGERPQARIITEKLLRNFEKYYEEEPNAE